jgi:triosephosphate isomerase (TIM)
MQLPMTSPKLLVAGNWKMNGVRADLDRIEAIKAVAGPPGAVDILLFPPATLVHAAATLAEGSPLKVGAQDCHTETSGAFTGDLSASMLKDAGVCALILGHSERRGGHGETSRMVRAKAATALNAGLGIIVCVGETRGEREAGLTSSVCARQLADSLPDESTPATTIVAYEPVWAIGSGLSPAPGEIARVHVLLRAHLHNRFQATETQRWRILYGGSVTSANAASIFDIGDVDGVLVGGASLNAPSFLAIIAAAQEARVRRDP